MLRETKFVKRHIKNYDTIIHNLKCIYYQGFIWAGYIVIMLVVAVKDFNLFNMVQVIVLAFFFFVHLMWMKGNPKSAHYKMLHLWGFFVLLNTLVASIKYLYSFLT